MIYIIFFKKTIRWTEKFLIVNEIIDCDIVICSKKNRANQNWNKLISKILPLTDCNNFGCMKYFDKNDTIFVFFCSNPFLISFVLKWSNTALHFILFLFKNSQLIVRIFHKICSLKFSHKAYEIQLSCWFVLCIDDSDELKWQKKSALFY